MQLNYHPDYGLPNSIRIAAIKKAKEIGVVNAAKLMRLSPSSIYNWLKKAEEQ